MLKNTEDGLIIKIKIVPNSSKNEIIMSGAVTFDAKVTNDTTITEDISNSVLASTMPGTKEELMSEKINSVITLLMS